LVDSSDPQALLIKTFMCVLPARFSETIDTFRMDRESLSCTDDPP
jgi:hypothetical protein